LSKIKIVINFQTFFKTLVNIYRKKALMWNIFGGGQGGQHNLPRPHRQIQFSREYLFLLKKITSLPSIFRFP